MNLAAESSLQQVSFWLLAPRAVPPGALRRSERNLENSLRVLDDVSNGIRDRGGFEPLRVDANDSDISLRDLVVASIIHDLEIITDGLFAPQLRHHPDSNRVAVANWFGKLREDFDARHPYVVCLKQFLPALSNRTE